MILTSLIIGATAAVIGIGGLMLFWDDIKDWLNNVIEKAPKILDAVIVGVKVFIKKIDEAIEEIAKTYQQDKHGQWHETTVTKTVDVSEVPPEILAKAKNKKEVDISKDLEEKLELSLS